VFSGVSVIRVNVHDVRWTYAQWHAWNIYLPFIPDRQITDYITFNDECSDCNDTHARAQVDSCMYRAATDGVGVYHGNGGRRSCLS
jgi:hypothetical protein